jgi:hypothetical protein
LHQQKKFFQALEKEGGLHASVKKVCDSNKEEFGHPGSELRRQYRNRVNHFRGVKKLKEYYQFLDEIGVTPNAEVKRSLRRGETFVVEEAEDEQSEASVGSTPLRGPPRSTATPLTSHPVPEKKACLVEDRIRRNPPVEPRLHLSATTTMALRPHASPGFSTSQFVSPVDSDPSFDPETKAFVQGMYPNWFRAFRCGFSLLGWYDVVAARSSRAASVSLVSHGCLLQDTMCTMKSLS